MIGYVGFVVAAALGALAAPSPDGQPTTVVLDATKADKSPSSVTVFVPGQTGIDLGSQFPDVSFDDQPKFQASVVDADACKTTYALRIDVGNDEGMLTVVEGPDHLSAGFSTSTMGNQIALQNTCDFDGSTKAVCQASASVSNAEINTKISGDKYTYTGEQVMSHYAEYPLVGGGDKLAKATGSCKKPWEGAAMPTGIAQAGVYKVIIVPAAAMVAAAMI